MVGRKNQSGKKIIHKFFIGLNWDSNSNGDNENCLVQTVIANRVQFKTVYYSIYGMMSFICSSISIQGLWANGVTLLKLTFMFSLQLSDK